MRSTRNAAIAAAMAIMTAPLAIMRGTEVPASIRRNPVDGIPKVDWGHAPSLTDLGYGRTKSRQSTAQNKRAARKAKNVKRHRRACRG